MGSEHVWCRPTTQKKKTTNNKQKSLTEDGEKVKQAQALTAIYSSNFFCWRLLGLIPGGTPFSQLNKGVRDLMSATSKRDVEHQVLQKHAKGHRYQQSPNTGQRMQSLTRAQRRRLRLKSKGKHLCQSGKMQPEEEGFGETRRKHLCRSQKCALETRKGKGLNKS